VSGSLRVLRAEIARTLTSWAAWFGVIMILVIPFLWVWVGVLADRAERIQRMAEGRTYLGLSEGTGWSTMVDGWRPALMIATALLLVQTARSLAGDRESGVLRLAVTRSASRSGAIVGRALLGPLITLAMVALSGLSAYVASSAFGGDFGDLVEDGDMIFSAGEVMDELRRSMLPVVLGMMAVHAFGLLISSLSRGPVIALAASLAAVLLWDIFKEDVGDKRWLVFASHAPTFADGSGMRELAGFSRGMSDAGMPEGVFRMGTILSPAEAIVFVLIACLAVRRRPL